MLKAKGMKENYKCEAGIRTWCSWDGWVLIVEVAIEGEDKHFGDYNA